MNLSEMRNETRRLLSETSATASYFSDADINAQLNEGLKDMCQRGGVLTKNYSFTAVTTVAAYTMQWDFIKPITVLNTAGVPLDAIPASTVGRVFTKTGYPLFYYFTHSNFTPATWGTSTSYVLFPTTTTATLTYVKPSTANGFMYEVITAGTSTTTEPTWPVDLGNTVADGAALVWACRPLRSRLVALNLYTTPTTAGGGVGSYTVIYTAMDEGLYTDTDAPNFPDNYHQFLPLYATYRCLLRARQANDAMTFYNDYATGIGVPLVGAAAELPGMGSSPKPAQG